MHEFPNSKQHVFLLQCSKRSILRFTDAFLKDVFERAAGGNPKTSDESERQREAATDKLSILLNFLKIGLCYSGRKLDDN